MSDSELSELLTEQVAYYGARAAEYDATTALDAAAKAELRAALDAFGARGRVLELACGTGEWTEVLARTADELTAIDASGEMLALNRARVVRRDVVYQRADLFEWTPDRRYDVVFFAAWLSHVPPARLADFWSRVDASLGPAGRVFLIDELPAADVVEERIGDTIAVRRQLADGRSYRAVKVLYEPGELEQRLIELGWRVRITKVGWRFLYATGKRAPSTGAER